MDMSILKTCTTFSSIALGLPLHTVSMSNFAGFAKFNFHGKCNGRSFHLLQLEHFQTLLQSRQVSESVQSTLLC